MVQAPAGRNVASPITDDRRRHSLSRCVELGTAGHGRARVRVLGVGGGGGKSGGSGVLGDQVTKNESPPFAYFIPLFLYFIILNQNKFVILSFNITYFLIITII